MLGSSGKRGVAVASFAEFSWYLLREVLDCRICDESLKVGELAAIVRRSDVGNCIWAMDKEWDVGRVGPDGGYS